LARAVKAAAASFWHNRFGQRFAAGLQLPAAQPLKARQTAKKQQETGFGTLAAL
jgi:hypothetical protein